MERRGLWPRTRWVREAFEALPRHDFAPARLWEWGGHAYQAVDRDADPVVWARLVYGDPYAATITSLREGVPASSLSCPAVVADMLAALRLRPGQRVLELGTGTGWNAALLAHRAGRGQVTSVEVDDELAAAARRRLEQAGADVHVRIGGGEAGDVPGDGYERIIVTFSVETVPWSWVAQARPGARIVAPWGRLGHVALTVSEDGRQAVGHVRGLAQFMPARDTAPRHVGFRRLRADHEPAHEHGLARDLTPLHQDWHLRFALRVAVSGLRLTTATDADGTSAWLHDGISSWASLTAAGDGTLLVREGGPRRLAEEAVAAWDAWLADGAPDLYAYGLTVAEGEQYAWARDPETGPRWFLAPVNSPAGLGNG